MHPEAISCTVYSIPRAGTHALMKVMRLIGFQEWKQFFTESHKQHFKEVFAGCDNPGHKNTSLYVECRCGK